jgi:CRISPR/Cas system-associated exonuclease Cas4 (RecB family)
MSQINEEKVQQETQWIHSLAEELGKILDESTAAGITRSPHQSNWASELGHQCDLYLVYQRVKWEQGKLTDLNLQYVFNEGRKQERLIMQELESMGIEILQRGVSVGMDATLRKLNIGGKLDGLANCAAIAHRLPIGIDWGRKKVVIEAKSLSPHNWEKLVDYDALMTSRHEYVKRWAHQMQLYLLGHSDEAGLFAFKNKVTGRIRFIPVLLDIETCDMLARKAERVNLLVEEYNKRGDSALPAPIAWNQALCGDCKYLHICPNSRDIPETEISTDKELIELLERREALKPMSDEYDDVKDAIDDRLERFQGKPLLIGDWLVRWVEVKRAEKLMPAMSYFQKRIAKVGEKKK